MCMNTNEVSELCMLIVQHIKRCKDSAQLPTLVVPPFVPEVHNQNLLELACSTEILARRLDGVLQEDQRIDMDALYHSFLESETEVVN